MIVYKNIDEIEQMERAGKILSKVLASALKKLKPGLTTSYIDQEIEKEIILLGGEPGFKKVKGYHWASCICINEQVVHTPPSNRIIKKSDVVTIDTGVFLNGFHTDSAWTIQVEVKNPEITRFLETGQRALKEALNVAKKGNYIGNISKAFQDVIEGAHYSKVRELTGHGVGKDLHEDPYIPCYIDRPIEKTLEIQDGMTLALEVMYSMGGREIIYERPGWSIEIADGSISASFEHTIAIKQGKTLVLTK